MGISGSSRKNREEETAMANTGIYNVRDYGATGDGSSDDTAAIQSTINASHTGGIVYFPAGLFRVTQQLTVSSSLGLVGESGSHIRFAANGARLFLDNCSNVRVAQLELDGADYSNHTQCLIFVRCQHMVVEDCYVHHSWHNGIQVDSSGPKVSVTDNTDLRISHCRIEYTGNAHDRQFTPHSQGCGIWMTATTDYRIESNVLSQTAGDGAIFVAGPCSRGTISHNAIDTTWWRGIELYQTVERTTLEGNVIGHTGGANTGNSGVGCNGIFVDQNRTPGTILIRGNQIAYTAENGIEGNAVVIGNIVNTTGAYANLSTPSIEGIYLESFGVAEDNYVYDAGGDGIKLDGDVRNFLVAGNSILNSGNAAAGQYSGIHVQAQGGPGARIQNGQVTGNIVIDNQGNTQYGILVENSGDGSKVDWNSFSVTNNQICGIANRIKLTG